MKGCPERMYFAVQPGPIFYPTPSGEEPLDLPVRKVEYIRADIHAARIADLERQLAEARDKALEEAAKACDRRAGNASDFNRYTRKAAGMCAADIRNLKGTP